MRKQLNFSVQNDGLHKSKQALWSCDQAGSKTEKQALKTRRVTCELICCMKMLLCFNSSFPKPVLSCVLGCPLNGAGDFEESLAAPARTLESRLKTSE